MQEAACQGPAQGLHVHGEFRIMRRPCPYVCAAWLVAGFVNAPAARAADATNAPAPAPATNTAPVGWSWTPTAEQKTLESGKYFATTVDAAHHVVQHRLYNRAPVTPQETSICNIARTVTPDGKAITTAEVGVRRALSEPACFFDGIRPLVFVVDGVRSEITSNLARVDSGKETTAYGLVWRSTYFTVVSEPLLRALAKASAGSVEVPCKRGAKWEHTFSAEELARFATFVRVYMGPAEPATTGAQP
jgi:hypothetical protein